MSEVLLALACEHKPERALGKSEEIWLLVLGFLTQEETSHGRHRNHSNQRADTILHLEKMNFTQDKYARKEVLIKENSSKKSQFL